MLRRGKHEDTKGRKRREGEGERRNTKCTLGRGRDRRFFGVDGRADCGAERG
jgi:hypothetical protein